MFLSLEFHSDFYQSVFLPLASQPMTTPFSLTSIIRLTFHSTRTEVVSPLLKECKRNALKLLLTIIQDRGLSSEAIIIQTNNTPVLDLNCYIKAN